MSITFDNWDLISFTVTAKELSNYLLVPPIDSINVKYSKNVSDSLAK